MNGVSRTVLNSAPIQKMYEEALMRNAGSRIQTGGGPHDSAIGGVVGNIVKNVLPKTTRKRKRKLAGVVQKTMGHVARALQRGSGRRKRPAGRAARPMQRGKGQKRRAVSRVTLNRKPTLGRKRGQVRVIKGRGSRISRIKKQSGGGSRRRSRSRTVRI